MMGVPVGELQAELNIPNSTLSHHLNRLINVGLIEKQREGTTLFCMPNYVEFQNLIDFLQEECCINDDACAPQKPTA